MARRAARNSSPTSTPALAPSTPAGFLTVGGTTYFVAFEPEHGAEVWGTDESGTHLFKDILPGPGNSLPYGREVSGGTAYFAANDGNEGIGGEHGYELWKSDGTPAGTVLVRDIHPGPISGLVSSPFPDNAELTDLNGTLYFSADDGTNGEELWESHGSEADTLMAADINLAGSSSPRALTSVNNVLFFTADDGEGSGRQLFELTTDVLDTDGDGIADEIDTEPGVSSNSFSDHAAPTFGTILDRSGLDVSIIDAAYTDGVSVKVGAGEGEVTLSVCGGFVAKVKAGTEALITCGSVSVQVIEGEAEVAAADGSIGVKVPNEGVAKLIEDESDGSVTVENQGTAPVVITLPKANSSVTVTVPPAGSAKLVQNPANGDVKVENTGEVNLTVEDEGGPSEIEPEGESSVQDTVAPAAPSLTATAPASPANENSPKAKGAAEAGSTVALYTSSDCSGSPLASGPAAELGAAGIAFAVADDSSTTLRATATDAAANTSACSGPLTYTEDSTAPAAPSLTATAPASPANENSPKAKGAAEAGSTVALYTSSDCSGSPLASGPAAELGAAGIAFAVADDSSTTLRATATDAAANASACSGPLTYTEDSTAPAAPSLTATAPGSPANENSPKAKGAAEAGSTVALYTSSDCSGSPLASGPAAELGAAGIAFAVADDSSTTLRATATDAAANTSACSGPLTYTEDSTAPAAPSLTATAPASPANENSPKAKGAAEAGSTVALYTSSDCSGSPLASGPAAELGAAGIAFAVADDSSTTLRATATDAAANTSPCSGPLTYTEDSTAPAAPSLTATAPASPANENSPKAKGAAEAGSTVALYTSSDCSGSPLASGPAAELGAAGIGFAVADDSSTTLRATATDAAANTSPCSGPLTYTEDSTAPAAPSLTATAPASPANENSPKAKGAAEAGSTVALYTSSDCSGSPLASGPAAELGAAGIGFAVADDSSTTLRATATDAAANVSACSGPLTYTEDSTAPETSIDSASVGSGQHPAATVAFSSEPGATFECQLDGAGFQSCSSPATLPNLAKGSHSFEVRASDAAGNVDPTPAASSFVVKASLRCKRGFVKKKARGKVRCVKKKKKHKHRKHKHRKKHRRHQG